MTRSSQRGGVACGATFSQEGSASPLVIALLALVALLCLATADAANVVMARARAQTAADAAALAAAVARLIEDEHRKPQDAAESVAESNGASFESCECTGPQVIVTVSVATRTRMLGVAPSHVRASAAAEVDMAGLFRPPDG